MQCSLLCLFRILHALNSYQRHTGGYTIIESCRCCLCCLFIPFILHNLVEVVVKIEVDMSFFSKLTKEVEGMFDDKKKEKTADHGQQGMESSSLFGLSRLCATHSSHTYHRL